MELKFETKHKYVYGEEDRIHNGLFKAQDLLLGRDVAIKEAKIQGDSSREIKENYNKTISELKAMVLIAEKTPWIPNIYEYYWQEKESKLYIVMQWINGETLESKMNDAITTADKFLTWMCRLCHILKGMDKNYGFHHKDIKPQNIMICKDDDNDNIYLIDFNITVSTPNIREGTAYYKAPEMGSSHLNPERDKVDMFSMGVILYEFFTKELPEEGVNYYIDAKYKKKWTYFMEPKELNPDINETVNHIIVKAMSYDPKDRYYNYGELERELKKARKEINYGN